MKEGDIISKTKMIKFLTGKTQTMWNRDEKCFKPVALTTRYDGQEARITMLKTADPYQVIRAITDTQEIKLIYNVKKQEVTQGTILPVGWRDQ
jgi:hypothetical protein